MELNIAMTDLSYQNLHCISSEKMFKTRKMIFKQETIDAIKDIVVSREETLAVAESVTAGHLQAAFSIAIDASKYFQGGITAYNLGQKSRHLNVEPILAEKKNCIEQRIANTMALEVAKKFSSNYGIAITGYASMVPECEKTGLYAFFAVAYNNKIILEKRITSPEKNPHEVQIDYTNQVIQQVYGYLTTKQLKV